MSRPPKFVVQHHAKMIADYKPTDKNQLECKNGELLFIEEEGKKK